MFLFYFICLQKKTIKKKCSHLFCRIKTLNFRVILNKKFEWSKLKVLSTTLCSGDLQGSWAQGGTLLCGVVWPGNAGRVSTWYSNTPSVLWGLRARRTFAAGSDWDVVRRCSCFQCGVFDWKFSKLLWSICGVFRWVTSKAKKDDADEEIAKYDGKSSAQLRKERWTSFVLFQSWRITVWPLHCLLFQINVLFALST